jgi:hypothetical protein
MMVEHSFLQMVPSLFLEVVVQKTEEEIKEYKDLLAQGLVQPTNMELYVCNVDGSDLKKITDLGSANWAPFFTQVERKYYLAPIITVKQVDDLSLTCLWLI